MFTNIGWINIVQVSIFLSPASVLRYVLYVRLPVDFFLCVCFADAKNRKWKFNYKLDSFQTSALLLMWTPLLFQALRFITLQSFGLISCLCSLCKRSLQALLTLPSKYICFPFSCLFGRLFSLSWQSPWTSHTTIVQLVFLPCLFLCAFL